MVSNPTVHSVIVNSTSTAGYDHPAGRKIFRDKDHGTMVAAGRPDYSVEYWYSSDSTDGVSWSNGAQHTFETNRPYGGVDQPGTQRIWTAFHKNSEVQSHGIHAFDDGTAGTTGKFKTIGTYPNSAGTGGGVISAGSDGSLFAVSQEYVKSMGNTLRHCHIHEYDSGSSSWQDFGYLNSGSTSMRYISIAVDSQNRAHVAGQDHITGDLLYARYDQGSQSVAVSSETIGSNVAVPWNGRIVIDGSDRPIISSYHNGTLEQAPQLFRREAGSWNSKPLGDKSVSSSAHMVTTGQSDPDFFKGAIISGGEIHWYSGAWGDLGNSTTFEQLTATGNAKNTLNVHYQEHGGYSQPSDPIDITYVDEASNWQIKYLRAEHAVATSDPGSLTAASTTSFTASESVSPTRDAGSLTAATATPTTASSSTRSGDAGSLTAATTTSAAATSTATSVDVGALTAAQATPLAAGSTATATDAGGLTAATTTVLVADETVIVADTQTGTYQVGGGIEFGGPPSL